MSKNIYKILEIVGGIGALISLGFSLAWFLFFGFWAMELVDKNNLILRYTVLIIPSILGLGLVYLCNVLVRYSKRKLDK
jgi:hypothetical protein